ncbi:MAG: M13 family peptidase [Bacteroidetes bacterium]|nr:M13 family peptidase [Bacteroidota bacterium]
MKTKTNNQIKGILAFSMVLLGLTSYSQKQMTTIINTNSNEASINPENMDLSVNPGEDFFKYANGTWVKKNPIPGEFSRYGSFEVLAEKNNKALKTLMESAVNNKAAVKCSPGKQIGDFYAAGMDTVKIEKDGISFLKNEFDLISKITSSKEAQLVLAHFNYIGIRPLFNFYSGQDEKNSEMVIAQLYQGGIGLADRDYYLNDDSRSKEILKEYKKHLIKMFELLGDNNTLALSEAEIIINIETKLAKASMSRLEQRDPNKIYNKMDLAGLIKISPNFDWNQYFSSIGLKNPGDINVGQPLFFAEISNIVNEINTEEWKVYLKWNLLRKTAPYLNKAFVDENFNFYSKVLSGQTKMKERWKRVLNSTNDAMGELVGQLYVEQNFSPEAKASMLDLVANLKVALKSRIEKLEWMADTTKLLAAEKLAAMNVKIGYPDKWIDYSKLQVSRESYVMNVLNGNKFSFELDLSKIGKPVDRNEWGMFPQTVNAYFNPTMNEIVFPAAILQAPFFDVNADAAVNYGGIGSVIGHEMTHGFDDQGRLYDKKGNLNDWWTVQDAEKFKQHTQVLVDQYNAYFVLDTLHVDGELTLGENIADVGGVTVAYVALQNALKSKSKTVNDKLDGFTLQQRYFLSFAQVWRQNIRDKELMRRLKEDVHSPGVARVNCTLFNIPEFYNAFPVKTTDKLYKSEQNRAKIW